MPDKRLHRYVLKFLARRVDEARLKGVLERSLGARELEIAVAPVRGVASEVAQPPSNWRPRTGSVSSQIMELLAREGPLRASRIKAAIPAKHTASSIYYLFGIGAISRVAHGCYGLPGAVLKSIPPPHRMGPALKRIYDLLDTPLTAVELRLRLGVSRQAIDQSLKRLVQRKFVRRVGALGERGMHAYLRSDHRGIDRMVTRVVVLRENVASVLSRIPHDAPALVVDVAGKNPENFSRHQAVKRLAVLGLVDLSGSTHKRMVRLTNKGRQHPQYDLSAAKALPIARAMKLDRPSIEVLLCIHALGPVRALDVTFSTGIGRGRGGKGTGTGNYIQGLERSGLIEIAESAKGHPRYKLTKTGLSFVETLRGQIPFPSPDELRERLRTEWKAHIDSIKERSAGFQQRMGSLYNERCLAIRKLLEENGPTPTTEINARLPRPYPNPKSIHLTMKTLALRGLVVQIRPHNPRTKTPILWGVVSGKSANQSDVSVAGDSSAS